MKALAGVFGRMAVALLVVVGAALAQEPQPPQAAVDGFVPLSEVADREVLPAAPLVFYAYGFAWTMVMGYLWVIWRRVDRVQQDLAAVERRLAEGRRGSAR